MSTTALGGVSLTCRSWHRTDSKNRSRNISSSYYRKSLTSKSELIPTHSSRTAAMLVFVVLSVWACPSSTAVEAFVSPAATTSGFATPRGEFRKRSCCTSSTASVDPTTTAVAVGGFRYSRAYSSVLFFSSPRSRSSSKSSTCSDRLRSSNPLLSVTTATLSSTSSVFSAANDNGSPNGGSAGLKEEGETTVERSAKEGKKKQLIRVSTAGEMCRLLSQGESLFDLDARGDSQDMLEAREDEHPVLEVIRKRAKAGTKPGSHGDGLKVNLLESPLRSSFLSFCLTPPLPIIIVLVQSIRYKQYLDIYVWSRLYDIFTSKKYKNSKYIEQKTVGVSNPKLDES